MIRANRFARIGLRIACATKVGIAVFRGTPILHASWKKKTLFARFPPKSGRLKLQFLPPPIQFPIQSPLTCCRMNEYRPPSKIYLPPKQFRGIIFGGNATNSRNQLRKRPQMGVRSVVVEFGVFGAPRFSVQRSQNPLKIGIWGPLD